MEITKTPMNIKDLEEFDKRFKEMVEPVIREGPERLQSTQGRIDEIKHFIIQEHTNTIKQVLEMLPRKEHHEKCINRQDGYGHLFRDCDSFCQANGYNQCRNELESKLNKLIE